MTDPVETRLEQLSGYLEYLGSLSHDLRAVLSPIMGYTGLMQLTASDPEQREFLATMRRYENRALADIDYMVFIFKYLNGRRAEGQDWLEPGLVLDEAATAAQAWAAPFEIHVSADLLPGTPGSVRCAQAVPLVFKSLSDLFYRLIGDRGRGGCLSFSGELAAEGWFAFTIRQTYPCPPGTQVEQMQAFLAAPGEPPPTPNLPLPLVFARLLSRQVGARLALACGEGLAVTFEFPISETR